MFLKHHESLYTFDGTLKNNPIGRRMTVIKYNETECMLHSPIALEGRDKEALDALGKVTTILVPNHWHTLDTLTVFKDYPSAKVMVPLGIKDKIEDKCPVHGTYEEASSLLLDRELEVSLIEGLKKPEALFFHHASKTLIVTDLFFNFMKTDFSGFTGWLMSMNKATQFGITRLYNVSMVKDSKGLKRYLEGRCKAWDIDRIIMSHGHIIASNGEAYIHAVSRGM